MREDAVIDDAMVVARLRSAGCVFAEDEAAVLLSAARSSQELEALVQRRAAGEPLEQVVGWAEFAGLRIVVDPGVFVPRRRSEFLVSVSVGLARPRPGVGAGVPVIVDLCCGTGALGLAVATGLAGRAELHAADLDPAAVACARRNVERSARGDGQGAWPGGLGGGSPLCGKRAGAPLAGREREPSITEGKGHVYVGDLFEALPAGLLGRVDILICNAPYVPTGDIAFLPAEARDHESLVALDGGLDGLAVLRRAAAGAPGWLAPGGVLLVETSDGQAPEMAAAMADAGLSPAIHTDEDWGATVVTGRQPGRIAGN
jgi:release factor glutamine methyltransferase